MHTYNQSFKTEDGHEVSAYVAAPPAPRATLVVIQEIFGVNEHIKSVVESFAHASYRVVAPRLFDRIGSDITVPYTDIPQGRGLVGRIPREKTELDMRAVLAHQRSPIGVVGYCWGGSWAFLSACRLDVKCAVSYYGGQIPTWVDEMSPRVPVQYHLALNDAFISSEAQEHVKQKLPDGVFHHYPANHGFNCDARADFHAPSARSALVRTLSFFNRHLAPIS
ncbi:MAG: dienelactone hydrolase family protein [Myxococcota bacterium]